MHGAPPPSALPPGVPQSPITHFGFQTKQVWGSAQTDVRSLWDSVPNPTGELWRLSVVGNLRVFLEWGTSAKRTLILDAPIACDLPGNVSVRARPIGVDGATGLVTVAKSSGAGPQVLRLYTNTIGAVHDDATSFTALVASTVTVRGNAVVLTPGQTLPLVSGSSLTAGAGILEFIP
jgi:hypothetical protein